MALDEPPPGGTEIDDPPWDPWQPPEIARPLGGVDVPKHSAQATHQGDFDATLPMLDDGALGWLE